MGEGKGFFEKPDIIRVLEPKLKTWTVKNGVVHAEPKVASFNLLAIKREYKGLFATDPYEDFVASLVMVPQDEIKESHRSNYLQLVGTQTELAWGGILKRRPKFVPFSAIEEARKLEPRIVQNDRLPRALNEDNELMRKVTDLSPDHLLVILRFPLLQSAKPNEFVARLVDYYRSPLEIAWNIETGRFLPRMLDYAKSVNGLFDILDSVSHVVLRICSEILRESSV